jgi:small multidrug resistance pump
VVVWLLLAGAILCEVSATICLRLSDGLSRPAPTVVVLVGYLASFVLLARALHRGLSVAVAYGIWSAVGVSLVALVGALFLGESLSWIQVTGLALVIAGVVALQSGATPG